MPEGNPRPLILRYLLFLFLAGISVGTGAESPVSPDVVVLEKVIVEAAQPQNNGIFGPHNRWLYVALPGWEILSLTDSDVVLGAAQHLASLTDVEQQFIPAGYLPRAAVPSTFIMFDHPTSAAMDALIPSTIEGVDGRKFGNLDSHDTSIGGIDTADSDTHCVVQNRWGKRWPWSGGALARGPVPTGILFRLSMTKPALPLWYQFGFIGPCGLLQLTFQRDDYLAIACASWISASQTDAILATWAKETKPPRFPPIAGLFNIRAPDVRDAVTLWPSPEWMAEASLFLRWGLYGENVTKKSDDPRPGEAHRRAFEAFVERSRTEVVTEDLFKECFGYGYARAQSLMERYFIDAATKPILVPYEALEKGSHTPMDIKYRNLEVRPASEDEIARILGDWERMQAYSVRETRPELSKMFLKEAGRILHRSYDSGERDARLLAVLGLYDVDIGAKAEARVFLQTAVDSNVNRPEAFTELARINLELALSRLPASKSGLDAKSLASVLKPIFAARAIRTLTAGDYVLVAKAWAHSSVPPKPANLQILSEGLDLYPFDSQVREEANRCYAVWGNDNPKK